MARREFTILAARCLYGRSEARNAKNLDIRAQKPGKLQPTPRFQGLLKVLWIILERIGRMGSIRTWSLAVVAGILVVVVAHQHSAADAGMAAPQPATAAATVAAPASVAPASRVTGLPDFSGLVAD